MADYDYDDAGQLDTAVYTNAAPYQLDEDYDYDPNGNRLSVDYTDNNAVDLGAYWRLDEAGGTTTADASGNGLTATLGGTPAWITTGLVSQIANNVSALHFDSDGDYLANKANKVPPTNY